MHITNFFNVFDITTFSLFFFPNMLQFNQRWNEIRESQKLIK